MYERNPHSKWLPLLYVWRKGTEIATNIVCLMPLAWDRVWFSGTLVR